MNTTGGNTTVGFWPFDTERDDNLQVMVDEVWVALRERSAPKLPLTDRIRAFFIDIYRDPWEKFVREYMSVASSLGRPYLDQAEFYTVWEPKFAGMGEVKEVTEVILGEMRMMNAEGLIPAAVYDPANVKAPGDDSGSPFGETFKTVALWAIVGVVVYGAVTGFAKSAATRIGTKAARA
jgi:hypothetical protein